MSGWFVDAAIASALLMLGVLLIRAPVRRIFGPTIAYWLWASPVLRLMTPSLPEAWRDQATPISRASEFMAYTLAPVGPSTIDLPRVEDAPDPVGWAGLIVTLWLVGGLAFLALQFVRHARFRARLLQDHWVVERVRGVHVVLSPAAPGPLAFGVWRRYVVLPADLDERYDAEERALALAHELGHHARGDIAANWAALVVLAIHWWNPIAWAAHRAFRADQELANDARVLRNSGIAGAHAYACAILKTAHRGAIASTCHLHSVNDLKGRLRMLRNRPASPRRLAMGGVTVSILACAAIGLTASGTRAAAAAKAGVDEVTGVDITEELDRVIAAIPTPPAPPTPPAVIEPPRPVEPVLPVRAEAPPSPAAPANTAEPPIPPVPPVPPLASDRRISMIRDENGRIIHLRRLTVDGRRHDPRSIPEVSSRNCGWGERPVVRDETHGGRRTIIICKDRIGRIAERAARDGERAAELAALEARTAEHWARSTEARAYDPVDHDRVERDALRHALEGLRGAREAIRGNPQLTPDQKRDAIRGIDEGEQEVRENMERPD